jgi:hypothetical protein
MMSVGFVRSWEGKLMTHEQLLAEIDQWLIYSTAASDEKNKAIGVLKALRAVIQMHKPDEVDFPDEWESCVECSGNGYVAMYPCQTIKVIEKELA